jgi:hypothetical protein
MTNRKFWLTAAVDAGLILAATALRVCGKIDPGVWSHAVDVIAMLAGGYLGVNAGQKVGLAKVAPGGAPESSP